MPVQGKVGQGQGLAGQGQGQGEAGPCAPLRPRLGTHKGMASDS